MRGHLAGVVCARLIRHLVGFAVNNVGQSYDSPDYYQNVPDKDIADIVEINV